MINSLKYSSGRYLPFILLLMFMPFVTSCRYAREKGLFLDKELKKAQMSVTRDSVLTSDSIQKAIIMKEVSEVSQTDSSVRTEEEKPADNNTEGYYYIIVGTFTNHANARAAAGKFGSQGYQTTIISSVTSRGNKAELVAVKSFPDREKAKEYLAGFKEKVDPRAWIYPRE